MYFSVAETMPHDSDIKNPQDATPEVVFAQLAQAILDSACINPMEQAMRADPSSWPVRYLPPGKLADLFFMYQGWSRSRSIDPAGVYLFRQVWKSG